MTTPQRSQRIATAVRAYLMLPAACAAELNIKALPPSIHRM